MRESKVVYAGVSKRDAAQLRVERDENVAIIMMPLYRVSVRTNKKSSIASFPFHHHVFLLIQTTNFKSPPPIS